MTTAGDVLELVRAPAALTVLGDTIAGGHAGGARFTGRQWLLPLGSVFLYAGGMALNDYADRDLDTIERPERPIPSGRVPARCALGIATALMAVGVGLAAAGGGRRSLGIAVPLVGAIVLYNTVAKDTAAGPVSMAACRGLDVLMGGGGACAALPAAATMALHTAAVTATSRGEVHGGTTGTARAALVATGVTAVAALLGGPAAAGATRGSARGANLAGRPNGAKRAGAMTQVLAGAGAVAAVAVYVASTLPSQVKALADPSAANERSATRAGIGAMVPLQATLTARSGALGAAVLLGGVDLARRALSARRSRGDVT
jgi:4-hydroxybenzoate polyprenyltransferase